MNAGRDRAAPHGDRRPTKGVVPADAAETHVRQLWMITYPIMVSSLVPVLMTLVDSALLGRFSTGALAAVALASPIYIVGTVLATGWTTATQTLSAQHYGAGDRDAAGSVLAVSLLFTVGCTIVLSTALLLLAPMLVGLLTDDQEQRALSTTFLRIVSLSLPFFAVTGTYRAFYAGLGATQIAMFVAIGVTTVNIPVSYLLIFQLELGVTGAALGILTATALGSVAMIGYGYRRLPDLVIPFDRLTRAAWSELAPRIWAIGWPEVTMLGLGYVTGVLLIGIVATLGTDSVAASRLIQNLFVLIWSVVFSCSSGIAVLVGQRLGAKDLGGALTFQRAGLKLMAALAAVMMVPLFLPNLAFGLFTPDRAVVSEAASAAYFLVAIPPLMVPAMVMAGVLRAAGETRSILIAALAADYACYLPLAWLLAGFFGLPGVYAAFVGYWLVRLMVTHRRYAQGRWRAGLEDKEGDK